MFCEECQAAVAIGTAVNDAVAVARGPFQHLHAAHRAADHAEQLVDAEMVDQRHLRVDHVADGDDGEIEAPGLAGLRIDAWPGPVEPMQPPSTLGQMTKKRLVSIGLPGPTMVSHQPGLPVTGCGLATYWSPVSAWETRMAFDFAALSSP